MPRQRAADHADPALRALSGAAPGALLLHSGRHHPRWATRSLLAHPVAWFRHHVGHRSTLNAAQGGAPLTLTQPLTGNLWTDLRHLLSDPKFPGRWFGYISYDVASLVEPTKLQPPAETAWPLVELGWCPDVTELRIADCGSRIEKAEEQADAKLFLPPQIRNPQSTIRNFYLAAVRRALDYIAAGDIFQVNIAQRFDAEFTGRPRDLFTRLATISPAWYGAYLELPALRIADRGLRIEEPPERVICSTSPELFLQLQNSHVITRPIKGTRPNSTSSNPQSAIRNPQSDPNLADLLHSAKDTAELNMIVDLMRNDLGKVCAYGSVHVTHPREVESHPTVHHTTATIEGTLHPSKDVVDLLRATLPGGSITGAPKVRAMQIIAELEPVPRGPYTGCIGYLSHDEARLSVAIRTILLERIADRGLRIADLKTKPDGESASRRGSPNPQSTIRNPQYSATFSTGSGIVADSNPDAEYDETLTKAQAMLRALAPDLDPV
jgi:para-aminobenzoate synthetase component 1